jgi:hypothetical protein
MGIISVGFDVTDQLWSDFLHLSGESECNETVHKLFVDFKEAYDSMSRELLCNTLIEFGYPWN